MKTISEEIDSSKSKKDQYRAYKMFVLILIGHGNDGSFSGPDGSVRLADIYKKLSDFELMRGKPKWIIVNACSGSGKIDLYH